MPRPSATSGSPNTTVRCTRASRSGGSMRILKAGRRFALLGAALLLAAGSGLLSAVALGTSSADPAKTVTVEVGTGEQGPQGPPGPPGPAGPQGPSGGTTCPAGYSE